MITNSPKRIKKLLPTTNFAIDSTSCEGGLTRSVSIALKDTFSMTIIENEYLKVLL